MASSNSNAAVCSVNVTLGPKEERLLITGLHSVADIHCTSCNTVIGWKYVRSFRIPLDVTHCWRASARRLTVPSLLLEQVSAVEESQKYKEGKFILEKGKIMKVPWPRARGMSTVAAWECLAACERSFRVAAGGQLVAWAPPHHRCLIEQLVSTLSVSRVSDLDLDMLSSAARLCTARHSSRSGQHTIKEARSRLSVAVATQCNLCTDCMCFIVADV